MQQHSAPDVVVVGAGVIGCAVAWRLATAGHQVTLVDPDVGQAASWVAAGMLAPVTESSFGEAELLRLNLAAVRAFPGFVTELESLTGEVVGLRREGTLTVAHDADDLAVLRRLTAFRADLGLESQVLDGRACRRLEPFLAADVRGGVVAVGDLSVDNRRYLSALRMAVELVGVRSIVGSVRRVLSADGVATGVQLGTGATLSAGSVVVAAGCWSSGVGGIEPAAPSVRPVKGQLLRLRLPASMPPILTHTLRGLVEGREIYLVPRADGEVVVGATVEERGFDRTVTVGGVHDLLREATALLPVVAELELAEMCVGLRPGTPDNGPLVGATSIGGLVMATGHYRGGVLLSALTAEAVVAAVTGGPLIQEWEAFGAERFAWGLAG